MFQKVAYRQTVFRTGEISLRNESSASFVVYSERTCLGSCSMEAVDLSPKLESLSKVLLELSEEVQRLEAQCLFLCDFVLIFLIDIKNIKVLKVA